MNVRNQDQQPGLMNAPHGVVDDSVVAVAYSRVIYDRGVPVDFQYLYVNSAFQLLTGLEGVVGKLASVAIPGIFELHPGLLDVYDRVASRGLEQKFEIFVPDLNKWLLIRAIQPEPGHFLAMFSASSTPKVSSQELALVEAEHLALYESDLIGIVVIDVQKIARCNAAFAHMFGYADEELVGQSAKILFNDEETFAEFTEQLAAGLRDGQTRRIYSCQRHKDGSRRYFKISYRPPAKNSALIVGVFIDITEKRMSQAKLSEVTDRLELILEASELGTWDWNITTGDVTVNERWCTMLGLGRDEVENNFSSWRERVHPEDLDTVVEAYKNHRDGRTAFYETEHRLRHKDGHWVWVLSHGKVVSRNKQNEPLRAAGTHLDISHRKRLESDTSSLLVQMEQLFRQIVPLRQQDAVPGPAVDALPADALSKRQRQILAKVAQGQSSSQIALELGISKATVVTHRRDLMRKLNLHSVAEVTRFALRHKLLQP